MISSLTKVKFLRYINSKIPPRFRRRYSYYKKTLDLIHEAEQSPDDYVKEMQLNRINYVIEAAWEIPGYQRYWEKSGFKKRSLKHLSEFTEIPVITKAYIRAHRDDFKPNQSKYKTTKTGGSTGTPFQSYDPLFLPRIEHAFIHSIWKRFYPEMGIKTKSTILRGAKLDGDYSYDPMKGLMLSAYQLTEKTARDFISLIEKYKTPILHAYPSSLIQFVKYLKKLDLYPSHHFSLIALGSEPLSPDQKEFLHDFFQAPITYWYGQGEKVVLAGNRPHTSKYVVEKMYGITEVLNEQATAVDTGEEGRIIGTSLWNTTMPLIRYDTNDRGIPGKHWETDIHQPEYFNDIKGRSHEFLVSKNDSLVPVTALTLSYRQFDEIKKVQFNQSTPGSATLLVELMPQVNDFNSAPLKELLDELLHNQVDVDIKVVPDIKPTEAGKHLYLVQNLKISDYNNERPK